MLNSLSVQQPMIDAPVGLVKSVFLGEEGQGITNKYLEKLLYS
jgi:hypothetical protein